MSRCMLSEGDYGQYQGPQRVTNAGVEYTLTSDCCWRARSSDQREMFFDNARAIKGMSSGCLTRVEALSLNERNSHSGTVMIREESRLRSAAKSDAAMPDLWRMSCLCLKTSEKMYSGAYKDSQGEKRRFLDFPYRMRAEIKQLVSITSSIYQPFVLYFFHKDLLIFSPILRASASVSFDLAVIARKSLRWEILSRMASRATSDQLISLDLSISRLSSSGTAKVIVGMSWNLLLFNLFNTVYIFIIYKPVCLLLGASMDQFDMALSDGERHFEFFPLHAVYGEDRG